MSERLDKVKLVKDEKGSWQRMDPIDNIGVSTLSLIKDAIEEGRNELAKDLVDYIFIPEHKLVHDAVGCDMQWGWPSFIARNYGEDAVYDAYRYIFRKGWARPWMFEQPKVEKRGTSAEYRLILNYAVRTRRGHRMGIQDGLLGYPVREYEDRFELDWDPCASGGRMLRGDPISGNPSLAGEPYNLAVTQAPHPWSWNKAGVSLYCVHCCIVHAQMEAEQYGYLNFLQVPPTINDKNAICKWIAYKDEDDTPEEFYTEIGKVKPERTSPPAQFKDTTKVIRELHSDDYEPYPYTELKIAIDAGNKEEALKALEAVRTLRREGAGARWHWAWMDYIVEKYGYNELYHALREVNYSFNPPPPPGTPKPTKDTIPSAEERARKAALWGRSDRSGPNIEGSVRIIDEPDRIVMELDPCGSGGRVRLDDPEDERGPATGPPCNLEVTKIAHPVAWGKVGVPHYCTRCCVQEEMRAITDTGYLTTVVEWNENPNDPCRWFFYKDLDDVPEEFYTRIGAKKPAVQS